MKERNKTTFPMKEKVCFYGIGQCEERNKCVKGKDEEDEAVA